MGRWGDGRGERKKGWGNDSADAGTRGRGDAENGNPTQNFAHPDGRDKGDKGDKENGVYLIEFNLTFRTTLTWV
ncbi:MAG: hypothetical protein F6K47_02100 [Symploca sp. SIO2E6]|nr:hypothetical protein [Symploca sp. SIO2E6]